MMYKINHIIQRSRYKRNRSIENFTEGEYINGQALGAVSEMRYGLCRMSYNGCGSIAVYNALVYLGMKPSLSDIAVRLERYRILFGIFGCNPKRIGRVLIEYRADFRHTDHISGRGAYIISFWTGKRFLSHIHTIFCTVDEKGVTAYNRYNKKASAVKYSSTEELLKGKSLVAAYEFQK